MYFLRMTLSIVMVSILSSSLVRAAGEFPVGEFPITSDPPSMGCSFDKYNNYFTSVLSIPSIHAFIPEKGMHPMHFFGLVESYYGKEFNRLILEKVVSKLPTCLSGLISEGMSRIYTETHGEYKKLLLQGKVDVAGSNFLSALLLKDTFFIGNAGSSCALLVKKDSAQYLTRSKMAAIDGGSGVAYLLPKKGLGVSLLANKDGYPFIFSVEDVIPDIVTHTIEKDDAYLVFVTFAVAKSVRSNEVMSLCLDRENLSSLQDVSQSICDLARSRNVQGEIATIVIDLRNHYVRKIIAPKAVRRYPQKRIKYQSIQSEEPK